MIGPRGEGAGLGELTCDVIGDSGEGLGGQGGGLLVEGGLLGGRVLAISGEGRGFLGRQDQGGLHGVVLRTDPGLHAGLELHRRCGDQNAGGRGERSEVELGPLDVARGHLGRLKDTCRPFSRPHNSRDGM